MDSVYDDKWLNINNVTTLSIDKLIKLEIINAKAPKNLLVLFKQVGFLS